MAHAYLTLDPRRRISSDPVRPTLPLKFATLAGTALLVFITCVAYLPALHGAFIFDDNLLLTENALIKAPDGLFRFWYTTQQPDYVPLTSTTLWIGWRLWGMDSTGYHLVNFALHIAATLLIWRILWKLSIPGSYLAALLFAVHPVNVESVAWVVQRKNTLSMLFFLLSILWYLREEENRGARDERTSGWKATLSPGHWYWLSLLAFTLAMFSKGSVAILPLLLLLIVWWQRGRITNWDLLRSAPFFLVAAVLTPVIVWFVTHGSGETVRNVTFLQRLLGAGTVVWFYLSKALAPIQLVFVYPQWDIQTNDLLWWLPLFGILGITALLWRQHHSRETMWSRSLLFVWGFFCIALLPVLGFTDVGYMRYSLVADHYEHIAVIGVVALVAAGCSAGHDQTQGALRTAATAVMVFLVGVLAFLTWHQNRLYRGPITLYQATLKHNPASSMVHNNLAAALNDAGRPEEAIEQCQLALQFSNDSSSAHDNLAAALNNADRPQEAIEQSQQALRLATDNTDRSNAFNNLAVALVRLGKNSDAILQYQESLRLKPGSAEVRNNLGNALLDAGRPEKAIEYFQQALRLNPNDAEVASNLGNALTDLGRLNDAIEQYQQALRIRPTYAGAHNNLGIALAKAGRVPEAIEHFEQAVRLRSNYIEAYANLTRAYAQLDRPADAIATAQKALKLARSQGQMALAQQIDSWLTNYRSQRAKPQNVSPQPEPAQPAP